MSFEALRALIIASGYELRFRENDWVECLLLKDDEQWLGRGRDRVSALHAAVHLACPSSLARDLLSSRIDHLAAEAAAAIVEHREKVFDAIASVAPETSEPAVALPPAEAAVGIGAREADVRPLRVPPELTPPPVRPPTYDRPRPAPRPYNTPPPLVRRDAVAPRIVDPPRAL